MKLLEQVLNELGGDTSKAFTVIPGFGAYFRGVKSLGGFSPAEITLAVGRQIIKIKGEKLEIAKYFQQDVFIKGAVAAVEIG